MAGKRELDKALRDSRGELILAAPRAVQVLRELMEDPEAPAKLRFDVAMHILERLNGSGGEAHVELEGELRDYAQ